MRPSLHKLPGDIHDSFVIWHQIESYFGLDWHYHAELELHYLIQGKGVRFIGDNVNQFKAGELILLGTDLPHFWKSNEEYLQGGNLVSEAIVIQFLPDSFGKDFLQLPETFMINQLYERAKGGLLIKGRAKEKVIELMTRALNAKNFERLVILLEIINVLANTNDATQIASFNTFIKTHESDTLRLNQIYNYTLNNFKQDLSLEKIASVANLSVTSFCRYFKTMTKKTYHDFLVEIRISHACRMIIEEEKSIEAICFKCGFNNVSNFYKHFKRVKGLTPLEYKGKFIERGEKFSHK